MSFIGREVRFANEAFKLALWDAVDRRTLPLEELKRVEVQEVAIDRGVSWEDALRMYKEAVVDIQNRAARGKKKVGFASSMFKEDGMI